MITIPVRLLAFSDLLGLAHILSSADGPYEIQHELIAKCRREKWPFLATMPERSRFRCEICGVEKGNAVMHFEDPQLPSSNPPVEMMWGTPVGQFVDIDHSVLHGILAHGASAPKEFQELLLAAEG